MAQRRRFVVVTVLTGVVLVATGFWLGRFSVHSSPVGYSEWNQALAEIIGCEMAKAPTPQGAIERLDSGQICKKLPGPQVEYFVTEDPPETDERRILSISACGREEHDGSYEIWISYGRWGHELYFVIRVGNAEDSRFLATRYLSWKVLDADAEKHTESSGPATSNPGN